MTQPDDPTKRIAGALHGIYCHILDDPEVWGELRKVRQDAYLRDAGDLIRELGLREERAQVARVAYDDPARFEPIPSRRYVTDWTTDEGNHP